MSLLGMEEETLILLLFGVFLAVPTIYYFTYLAVKKFYRPLR